MINALYRGKRADNGEWVYGYYVKDVRSYGLVSNPSYREEHQIWYNKDNKQVCAEVIPETVGQWTGMNDKNCIKIFEGDIIECDFYNAMVKIEHRKHLIIFENGAFAIQWRIGNDKYSNYLHETWGRKIIGNFYDNPELLD